MLLPEILPSSKSPLQVSIFVILLNCARTVGVSSPDPILI